MVARAPEPCNPAGGAIACRLRPCYADHHPQIDQPDGTSRERWRGEAGDKP